MDAYQKYFTSLKKHPKDELEKSFLFVP